MPLVSNLNPVPEELLSNPHARIQNLSEIGAAVEIDHSIPPKRYFRSGLEMMRMANIYYEEKNLENAFILYSKFITLFLEKLPHHHDYQMVPAVDRKNMKKKIKETFPKAEKIKGILQERYNQESIQWQQQKQKEDAKLTLEREEKNRTRQEKLLLEKEKQKYEEEKESRLNLERNKIDSENGAAMNDLNVDWPDLEGTSSNNEPSAPPIFTGATDFEPITQISIASKPQFDRKTKPQSLSHTQAQPGLRNIIVPVSLMSKFLTLAQLNTEKGIETCGLLAGCLAHNVFTVTHLLIPNQHGTSDGCDMENEEEIFEYQDEHNLLTLGWIHTHPTQTSFMSSVDLHTQYGYQRMMPEAVAIVCAPKFQETGLFALTQDYGLDYIGNCQETGFHPHPNESALYETCSHVITDNNASVTIVDLRKS